MGSEAPPAGTADKTLGMQGNAPMRSRSPNRPVRVEAPAENRLISDKAPQRASHTQGQTLGQSLDPHIYS
jgi:hypothetical protein